MGRTDGHVQQSAVEAEVIRQSRSNKQNKHTNKQTNTCLIALSEMPSEPEMKG